MSRRPAALSVYLFLEFSTALFLSLIFTVNLLYHVTVVGLNPLQLVLAGTILETTVFIFEIPTGVLADVKSRRLSVIVGYVLMGLGFVVEGSLPFFATVALAQVLWGLGYTFTSGATQAWIADEIGAERAGAAFLRGSQAGQVGGLVAIPIATALGSLSLTLPIVSGGVLLILLAGFLALTMTETGFTPAPPEERTTWAMMLKTVRDARQVTRRQPVLLALLGVGLFFGLYSEGFDRLWTPHLLDDFTALSAWSGGPVLAFGLIRGVEALLSLGATELARRRVDTRRTLPIARALTVNTAALVLALAGFGLTGNFWLALLLLWLVSALRSVQAPLHAAWFNRRIDDPQVRATMFSVTSQVDAVGQIAGGPLLGAVGNLSIRAALAAAAAILAPAVPLYALLARRGRTPDNAGKVEE